ncbi:MAG TPA: hypothetical protein VFB41_07710 [Solirubrobacteraceae bacterium]|nr:hypothetical protein [Solirubrobacteraceae bacterium]
MGALRRLVLAVVSVAALPVSSALAAPQVDGVFNLPGVMTNGQLTVGSDGNVYVALEQALGRVTPSGTTTAIASAALGNTLGSPTGGIASTSGFVWIAQTPSAGKEPIVKVPVANPSAATGVAGTGITTGATAMAAGPGGDIWVAVAGKIVKFSPANPAGATTYPVTGLAPKAITAASDGTMWVTDTANGGRLLNVTTAGVVTPYTVGGQPQFLGAGPAGQVVFGNPTTTPQQIGRLSPGATALTIDRPNGSDPFGVAFGADGAYWVAEFAGNRLARVTTTGQLTTLGGFPAVNGMGPRQIVAGPNKTLWATLDKPGDSANSKIARITGVEETAAGGAPPAADSTRPSVGKVKLSRSRVRAGTRSVILSFTSSEAASAKLVVSRQAKGRRRGKSCVAPTRKLRKARPCVRYVRIKTTTATVRAGANALSISTRALVAGHYRLVLTVTDAARNAAPAVTRTLTVTKPLRRRS